MNSLSKLGCAVEFPTKYYRALARLVIVSAFIIFASGFAAKVTAQSPTPEKPTPNTAAPRKPEITTGTIRGRLVAGDGQPLINASVMVSSLTGMRSMKPTRVDPEGRFVFDDLPAASYVIVGSAPGYIDQSMALGDPSQWPRHLIGSNVRVTMIKGGVITGSVTNAKGEPIVGVPVHATWQNGQFSVATFFSRGGVSETDDRGSYRIYGLMPGQYTVHAGGKGQFGRFSPNGFDIDVPTYYPSSTRDTAVPVSVRSGDETAGIDIRYKSAAGHSISGVVLGNVDASGSNGAITILLSHAGTATMLSVEIAAIIDARRAFSFNGVADGEYDLFANYLAGQNDNAMVGTRRVTVRGGDVTGVELNLAPLATIAGTITLDPVKPEDKCDKRESQVVEINVAAPRDEPKKSGAPSMIAMLASGLGTLNEKGEFAVRNLQAARYRLGIKLPTESWYVRAINVPGAAARVQPSPPPAVPLSAGNPKPWLGVVTVKSGEKLSGISVFVGQDAAGLRGRIETEGAIREGTRVYLVPVEREHTHNILRYSETSVMSDGSFTITNIAPGSYFILPRVEPPSALDASPPPIAWDVFTRLKLRRDAEAANTIVELKPCQRVVDYSLKLGTAQ